MHETDPAPEDSLRCVVGDEDVNLRFDAFLAARIPNHSRAKIQQAIAAGNATIDGQVVKPSHRLRRGENVRAEIIPQPAEPFAAEDVELDVLHDDDDFVVVNKPPGMVTHPSRGHVEGTLVAALQHRFNRLSSVAGPGRPGIVHRLDRDTSGVIAVAKTDQAHLALARQFESRQVEKQYFALVVGAPQLDRDIIRAPIGPHPQQREKMAIRSSGKNVRDAESRYEVQTRYRGFAALHVLPKTGRTHQIRLHLAHAGCPVLCDRLYGGRSRLTVADLVSEPTPSPPQEEVLLGRQALHALRLRLAHPSTGERLEFVAPLPDDIVAAEAALARYRPA